MPVKKIEGESKTNQVKLQTFDIQKVLTNARNTSPII